MHGICIKIEFGSQRRELLLFLYTNMADVTSHVKTIYWFHQNYLCVNVSKTQAMAVGPSLYRYDFKILGVIMDMKLSFKPHISEQLKKACAKASALRKVRKFIPQTTMIRLYKAYILPQIKNCSPLFLGI